MSKSKKWKQEWDFFLDADGRRKYADVCRRCVHGCKQRFRADVVRCPAYQPKGSDNPDLCQDKG